MVDAQCHCGAVSIVINGELAEVTECNCSICRRYGVLWAYFSPREVQVKPATGATDTYSWDDRSIEFHRCRQCGCVTHWQALDPTRDRIGVNARLIAPEIVARARLRHLDGANTEQYLD
jgi:hypothetical protein